MFATQFGVKHPLGIVVVTFFKFGMSAPVALQLASQADSLLYDDDVPHEVRFNGARGQERLDATFAMYELEVEEFIRMILALGTSPAVGTGKDTVPWFRADGSRLITRQPLV